MQLHEMFHLQERTLLLDYDPEVRVAFHLHLYLPLVPKLKVARSNKSENFLKVRLLNNEAGAS